MVKIVNRILSRVSRVKPNKAIILPAGPTTPDGFIQRTTPAPTVPSSELSSLKKATGDFSESNIIGRGGFGIVYEVRTSNYGFQCLNHSYSVATFILDRSIVLYSSRKKIDNMTSGCTITRDIYLMVEKLL